MKRYQEPMILHRARLLGIVLSCCLALASLFFYVPASDALFAALILLAIMCCAPVPLWAARNMRPARLTKTEFVASLSWRSRVGFPLLIAGLLAITIAGGGFTDESPEIRNGVRVAVVHGVVRRQVSVQEYHRLETIKLRHACLVTGGLLGFFAVMAQVLTVVSARRPNPTLPGSYSKS